MDTALPVGLNPLHCGRLIEDRRSQAAVPSGQMGTLEPRMSTASKSTTALPSLRPAAGGTSAIAAHARHALPGEQVRPFGDKVTALQRRRRTTLAARRAANGAGANTITLSSADATVAFHLATVTRGLLLERVQHRPVGTMLRQILLLHDRKEFEAWCTVEPLRLEEPATWARLRRAGDGVFDGRD
jgi:hypothetical protein